MSLFEGFCEGGLAMSSLNKVMLIGHLGRDPEYRVFSNGNPSCSFSMATSEQWRDKNTGQMQSKTEWHNIVLFGRLAEIARDYLKKGSLVFVEGKLQTRKWQDRNTGQDRYTTEIVGDNLRMLGGKGQSGGSGGQNARQDYAGGYEYEEQPDPSAHFRDDTPRQAPAAPRRQTVSAPTTPLDDLDDDIPF